MRARNFLRNPINLTIIFSIFFFCFTAQVVTIKGKYNGKDLKIQNPFAADGRGFCINKIEVNGQNLSDDLLYNNLIEIPFSKYKVKVGDFVILKVDHKKDCQPTILNADVLTEISASSFEMLKDVFGKNNQGIAFVRGIITDSETGKNIPDADVSIMDVNRESTYCLVRPKKDGSSLLAFPYNYQCVLEIEKEGYHKKRFLIDLRGVPVEKMAQEEFTVSISIESFKGHVLDSLLSQFPSAKLEYNPITQKVEWDEQYAQVIRSAEIQINDSLNKANQLDKEKNVRTILYTGLALILIFLLFLYSRYRVIASQKTIIEKQKKEVDSAYHSLDEKNKEVMDSIRYAQRIQNALLPTEKYVERVLGKNDDETKQ